MTSQRAPINRSAESAKPSFVLLITPRMHTVNGSKSMSSTINRHVLDTRYDRHQVPWRRAYLSIDLSRFRFRGLARSPFCSKRHREARWLMAQQTLPVTSSQQSSDLQPRVRNRTQETRRPRPCSAWPHPHRSPGKPSTSSPRPQPTS
jgi:hypothetical protein